MRTKSGGEPPHSKWAEQPRPKGLADMGRSVLRPYESKIRGPYGRNDTICVVDDVGKSKARVTQEQLGKICNLARWGAAGCAPRKA